MAGESADDDDDDVSVEEVVVVGKDEGIVSSSSEREGSEAFARLGWGTIGAIGAVRGNRELFVVAVLVVVVVNLYTRVLFVSVCRFWIGFVCVGEKRGMGEGSVSFFSLGSVRRGLPRSSYNLWGAVACCCRFCAAW